MQEATYNPIIGLLYKSLISKFNLHNLTAAVAIYLSTSSASQHVCICADTSNNSSMDTSDDDNQGWESDRSNTSHWSFLQLPPSVEEAPIKLHSYYNPH